MKYKAVSIFNEVSIFLLVSTLTLSGCGASKSDDTSEATGGMASSTLSAVSSVNPINSSLQDWIKNVAGDGQRMFVMGIAGLFTSLESDGLTWTKIEVQGEQLIAKYIAVDGVNKLIYAASWHDLYRLRYE